MNRHGIDVRSEVLATGHGSLTKHHEQAHANDPVNGYVTVGDCALLAQAVYFTDFPPNSPATRYVTETTLPRKAKGGTDRNPDDVDGVSVAAFSDRLSDWTCVAAWEAKGAHDTMNENGTFNAGGVPSLAIAYVGADLDKYHVDGFSAALYKSSSPGESRQYHYVLAFRGTEQASVCDWFNDVEQALGAYPLQYQHAAAVITDFAYKHIGDATTFTITGHSLGGGLAALASNLVPHIPTITFNAAGLHRASVAGARPLRHSDFSQELPYRYPDSLKGASFQRNGRPIRNYHVAYEAVTSLQTEPATLLGSRYITKSMRVAAVVGGAVALSVVADAFGQTPYMAYRVGQLAQKVISHGGIPAADGDQIRVPCIEGLSPIVLHLMKQVLVTLGAGPYNPEEAARLTYAMPDAEGDLPPEPPRAVEVRKQQAKDANGNIVGADDYE